MRPKRILVIKLRAIGDVVLSTAVLPGLREAYPDSEIHFLTETPSLPVVEGNPYIDQVVELSRGRSGRLRESLLFLKQVRSAQYDLVFDLFGNPRSALITWVSGAKTRVGFRFRGRSYAYNLCLPPRGDRIHEVEFNLDALRALKINVESPRPFFPVSENDSRIIQDWLDKTVEEKNKLLVGIHPWGSWEAKRWPIACFARLCDWLVTEYGATVVVMWGPGEKHVAESVLSMAEKPLYLAPQTSLRESAALLKRCQLVIANDSGPMHISAAVETPTVGIFGPTSHKLQGPYGHQHSTATLSGLKCLGCNKLTCPIGLPCMKELTVEMVANVVKDTIQKNALLHDSPNHD